MFVLSNQQARRYIPATELEIIRFQPLLLGELVWHLITQVKNSDLAAYLTVFDPRRDKYRHFIPCLVYALVYPRIASNIVALATLNPWYDSVRTHT